MKKIFIFMVILLMVGNVATAKPKKTEIKTSQVTNLIREYKRQDGFTAISVGNLGMGLLRTIMKAAAETEEEKTALNIMNGLHKIVVLEYQEAENSKKDEFNSKLDKIFDGVEKILEAKDENETLNIYGTSSSDGKTIDDLIIFVPEGCSLICFLGSISADSIADIVNISMND